MMLAIALTLLLAEPRTLAGKVVSVHDGDTITVIDADKVQFKIRLAAIDAPELKQPFGSRAKEALSKLVAGKDVAVRWSKHDRYGRILGDVYLGDRHVNREIVEAGMAWQYVRFDNSAELRIAEHVARDNRFGLWADRDPVPPWDWRRSSRRKTTP